MMEKNEQDFRTVRGYQLENYKEKKLTAAMEDYMEMLYRLCLQDGYARVGKLAEHLQVVPSSASKMVTKLLNMGYLSTDRNDSILLTDLGKQTGAYLLTRHDAVERFLTLLHGDAPLRETEMLEHTIEPETVKKLQQLLEFFGSNPEITAMWKTWGEQR